MIKLKHCNFNSWYNCLQNKEFIYSNEGIGDTVISVNFAKHRNTGIIRYYDNDYRNKFIDEYCKLIGVSYYLIDRKETDAIIKNNNYKKIYQFNFHNHYNIPNKDEIMSSIYMMNHGFIKQNDCNPNTIFICPMGSTNIDMRNRRFMDKNYFYPMVENLIRKNNKIYFVGIEKDIQEYGFIDGTKWINTNYIIHNSNDKEKINISTFLQMVANAKLAIAAPTSFPLISSMFAIPTLTLHRYNASNHPVTSNGNDNFHYHFYNTKWYKTLRMVSYQEIISHIDNM
jgi:hypothetical protein